MPLPRSHRHLWTVTAILLLVATLAVALLPHLTQAASPDPVTAAWQRARAAGSYRFTSDLTQVVLPLAALDNVGRTSRSEKMHMEGQNDLRVRQMAFTLWSEGGNVLQAESGVSVRMAEGKTLARRGAGEWEVVDEMTAGVAPQGDFLSYLAAVKEVQAQGRERRGGIAFSRYTFTIDSPRFALFMHQQMEAELRSRGELPPTVNLAVPAYFSEMVGTGELWVGDDGLPLRQILTLQFPAQDSEQVHAQVLVNFTQFGSAGLVPSAATDGLSAGVAALAGNLLPPLAAVLPLLAGAALLLYYRRTRLVQVSVAAVVILAEVAGPVVMAQANLRFFDMQTAKAAGQQERQAAADEQRDLRAALGTPQFDPHASPLERAEQERQSAAAPLEAAANAGAEAPAAAVHNRPAEIEALASDTGLDTDGDTLTDFAEERVGTSLANADTDGDGLADNVEVRGFTLGGQPWYTDPTLTDSNGDSLVDGVEWGLDGNGSPLAAPLDSDGDGMPDIYDMDNDGDGVPDNKDLAPFAKGAALFAETAPLQLAINNLSPGVPTLVDFQLRPQDAKQLWFAYNVLDWPQDDAGQMRDVDNQTYANVATAGGRSADASEANGDMKVIPMLEIRMPASGGNLPPQSDLTPFNITVNNLSADGQTKVAYVPLSIVSDEKTGERVAFSAQMRYLPTGSWPVAHEVRLAWVVQALVDQPCDKAADTSADCQADGYRNNVAQMVQSYYSDWSLTGLTVREEHGTELAIIYEDPAVDDNKQDDAAIWAFSHVMERHFTVARDTDSDGQRDLKVADLAARFDRDNNPSDSQRMDVPNRLQVVTRSYTTVDGALASTTMTETAAILNTVFQPHVNTDRQIKPLLFFAQEQRVRQLTLSLALAGGGYVTQNGPALTVDMGPAGSPPLAVDVVAGVKWMSYCAPATGAVNLLPCDDDVYWEELARRYGALPSLPEDEATDWMSGRLQFAQLYYTSLRSGYYSAVQNGSAIPNYLLPLQSEPATAAALRGSLRGAATVPVLAGFHFTFLAPAGSGGNILTFGAKLQKSVAEAANALKNAGRGGYSSAANQSAKISTLANAERTLRSAKLRLLSFRLQAAGAALSVLQVTMQILTFIPGLPLVARGVLGSLSLVLNLGITVIMPAIALFRAFSLKSVAQLFNGTATISRSMKVGGAVGAVIGIAVTWGFFIYGAVEGGLVAGSPALNRAFFEAVAATVVIVLLAVLALNPVGLIISALLGVIDFLLTLTCELGVKELRSVPGQEGSCFTLTGTATKYLAKVLYNYDLMINMERSDLMLAGAPQVTLSSPERGYVGGNTISIALPVTTTAVHKDPNPGNGLLIYPYMYLFSADNLRRSSFQYSLTEGRDETPAAALDQMPSLWQNVEKDHTYLVSPMYRGKLRTDPAPLTALPLAVGVDRTVPFKLNMGYAVPAYECWILGVIPICYPREFKGENHIPIGSLAFDVLPPTLEGFLALGAKGNGGLGLGWDPRFPALADADGDGLRSAAYNGLDPNDGSADGDGDGLTDRFELDQQVAGTVISPVQRDTDSDGLTDLQEIRLATNPGVADSDNDGLKDGEEVAHIKFDPDTGAPTAVWEGGWSVTINAAAPFTVRVSSDPLGADGDNDGLTDLSERQLAQDPNAPNRLDSQNQPYHPAIPNSPPLALLVATDDLDGYVAPGQSVLYTTTAVAATALVPGVLDVQTAGILGAARKPLPLAFDPLTFSGAQTVTQAISLTVPMGSSTQPASLASRAGTRLQGSAAPAWSFGPVVTEAPLGGIAAPNLPYYSDVTASRADRQDSYHIAALAFESLGPIGRGDILAYTLPGGSMRAIEGDANNTAAFMGNTAPSLASNTNGDTLAAWSQQRYCNTITLNSVRVVTAGADAQDAAGGIEPLITLTPDGGTESTAWRWDTAGGTSMTGGQGRGPNAGGLPVNVPYCNGTASLAVYDNDGATDQIVQARPIDVYAPFAGVLTFSGAGHTIEVNVTVPLLDRLVIAGALLGPDGAVKQAVSFPRSPVPTTELTGNFGPAVASNGSGFLVAYESYAQNAGSLTPGNPQVVVQAFDAAGNPLNSSFGDAASTQASAAQTNQIALSAAWIGDAYRVVWQDRRAGRVYMADAAADGSALTAPINLFNNALTAAGAAYAPGIAYDPISGRSLVVFLSDVKRVIGLIYQGNTRIGNPLVLTLDQYPAGRTPQVAWNPAYRGWLVSYQDDTASQRHVFVPLNADGAQAFTPTTGFFIAADDNSLACPAPQSAAVVDLRFEELPGAAAFADASGRGANATCTGAECPAAGFSGAPNAALSDYAVQFDGVDDGLTLNRTIQDDFTITFWIKAPPTEIQQMLVDGGDFNTNGFRLSLSKGGLVLRVPNMGIQMSGRIDDGQWHFVAFSRNKSTGRIEAYVDGNRVIGIDGGTPGVALDGVPDLRIGKSRTGIIPPLNATLDQFQIFGAALAQDAVQGLLNRSLQAYCVAAGTWESNVYWAKVGASQPDGRGGPLSVSRGLTLTIDSDLPTAQMTSVPNNAVVGSGQVLGGVAADATSGVLAVEVSINDGPWQAATGANSWAYSLGGQSGPLSLRVRAVDSVGNFGVPSGPVNLTVDSTAPALAINAPAAPVVPAKNAGGVWQVNLTGTASDANGVKPDSVKVRLEQQAGVGVAQTAQAAALNGSAWSIAYLLDAGLFDPTGPYTVTVEATDSVGNRSAPATAIVRLDARGPEATLDNRFAATQAISQTITVGGGVADTGSIAGIDKIEIAFTSVEQIAALPPGLTAAQAEAQLNRTWTPVSLAQRGAGVAATTWSYALPSGLENLYQLDLRATDMLGNVAISANLWRGTIDTTDPRLVMTATPTGANYLDAGGQRRYAVRFLCAAADRHLDERSFACPGASVAEPVRSFAAIPQLQTLFPDLAIRNGLAISYTLWQASTTPTASVRACDTLGRCAQAATPPASALGALAAEEAGPAAALASPQAVIVAPTADSFVAGSNTLSVTVAAEASALLKSVTISLDGQAVQTLDFAQGDAVTQTQRALSIPNVAEGAHTLVAQATDWAGGTQTTVFPISFTLDTAPPALAIDASALTNADTWQPQSGILRFNGTADDSVGLAAVRVQVDGGEFVDATFGGGSWQTALFVPDPEGRTLSVTVRATDLAGRSTEVTQPVATDLSAADAPDTQIGSGPANPDNTGAASFTFSGSASAVAFECQVDAQSYQPCASPQSYSGFSQGSHIFRVRAIDSRGFVDLSPATLSWTVAGSQINVALGSTPSNPTIERSATFTFAGDGSAASFECSLDAAPFAACTSPQSYSGLGYGEHTFAVRGINSAGATGAALRYTWTVLNISPVANDQRVSVAMNGSVDILLTATDNEPLRYSVATGVAHGLLSGLAPSLRYTPDTGYQGEDSFTFTAADDHGGVATGVVSITVTEGASSEKMYLPYVMRMTPAPGGEPGAQE